MARERRQRTRSAPMIDLIREIIDTRGLLPVAARTLAPNANLYDAGFSPFAAIQLTLALEEARGVEFPRQMLRRQSFSSLDSIAACLERVERKAA
jgi:acyl carrier protein